MTDVKINVGANVKPVQKQVEDLGKTVEKQHAKVKWKPVEIDLKGIERDLRKVEQMVKDFQRRTGMGSAQNVVGQIIAPSAPQSSAPSSASSAPSGTGPRARRGRYAQDPDVFDVARNFAGGVGGGFGTIASYAARGAYAGASGGGGAIGGGFGLLKGAGIGALAFGALKAGQAVNEGYEMAKERAFTLDTLKRQMGDLGKSFEVLKAASDHVGASFGVNSQHAAKLMEDYNKLSRGADKSEEDLAASVVVSGRTARAYGVDPNVANNYFAGIRHIDPRKSNRELATMLAEAVSRSGMSARADEVMQAIQGFTSVAARMSLTSPNAAAFAGSYSALVGSKTPGMDSENAVNLLMQANANMMRMGAAGEAGRAFTYSAFGRYGYINPIEAQALAQGGLFGTRRQVFGSDTPLGKALGNRAATLAGGSGADVTNMEAVISRIRALGGSKAMQIESLDNYFGIGSLQKSAMLYDLQGKSGQFGALSKSLRDSGVDPMKVNEKGLQTLTRIGLAGDMNELSGIFREMGGRTGRGALTPQERDAITAARATGDTEEFRRAMIRIAAEKDQVETEGSKTRDSLAAIERTQIKVGDALLGPMNAMRDALLASLGVGEFGLSKMIGSIRKTDVEDARSNAHAAISDRYDSIRAAIARTGQDEIYEDEGRVQFGSRQYDLRMKELKRQEEAEHKQTELRFNQAAAMVDKGYVPSTDASGEVTYLPPDAKSPTGEKPVVVDLRSTVKLEDGKGYVVSESRSDVRVRRPSASGQAEVVQQ